MAQFVESEIRRLYEENQWAIGALNVQGDDAMSDERDPTLELQALVEQLGAGDWRMALEAETALVRAGQAGIEAALWGLAHPNARVRRGCAGFMDHHGTDACFAALQWTALHDPAPSVRRVAVHSASCQRCKPCPLTGDLVGLLVQVALSDTNRRVRENAIGGLRYQSQDARAVAALETILRTETDPRLRREAHHALKHQDPNYRARVDAQARERGIATARARKEQQLLRQSTGSCEQRRNQGFSQVLLVHPAITTWFLHCPAYMSRLFEGKA